MQDDVDTDDIEDPVAYFTLAGQMEALRTRKEKNTRSTRIDEWLNKIVFWLVCADLGVLLAIFVVRLGY